MTTIETVTGPVDADALGVTLIHEHVLDRDEGVADQWPGFYDEEAEMQAAVEQLSNVAEHGVETVVDPTAMFGGRNVEFMRRASEQAGVRLVPCTEWHSPTVRIGVASAAAQHSIAIGLT